MPIPVLPLVADALAVYRGGERNREIRQGFGHPRGIRAGMLRSRLLFCLADHVQRPDHVLPRCGFLLRRDPDTLLAPDVAYVRHERAGSLGDRYVPCPPNLAAELILPIHTDACAVQRAAAYLDAGTRSVWLILLASRLILVCSPDGVARLLTVGDDLDGGDVLPGFRVAVADLFREQGAPRARGEHR